MNWGIRITIVYTGFVILISSLVFISATNKSELVTKDYYSQELKYQDRIDAIENEKKLNLTIEYAIEEDQIILTYPQTEINKTFNGEVLFFRPSDASKDLKLNLNFDIDGKQVIKKSKFIKGIYKMCITWKSNDKTFYKEQIINM
ncbi:MAG: FixH family protein [Bacteroidetes bacterium]|nr:FixH family protein [Bacteroidota bacterium]